MPTWRRRRSLRLRSAPAASLGQGVSAVGGGLNPDETAASVAWALDRFVYINCLLAVFNLIPIAPLDGEKVLAPFLPGALADRLAHLGPWGFLILLLIVFRLPWLISEPIGALYSLSLSVSMAVRAALGAG